MLIGWGRRVACGMLWEASGMLRLASDLILYSLLFLSKRDYMYGFVIGMLDGWGRRVACGLLREASGMFRFASELLLYSILFLSKRGYM